MESEPKLMPQYWKDDKKVDLPDNCKACKLMYFHCDFSCWHGSEECLKNISKKLKKKLK
jgi:hypothetical protein